MPVHPNSVKNLIRTGRPKGAVGKRTKLLRRLDPDLSDLAVSPKAAMARGMAYFEKKAKELLKEIEKARAQGIPISEFGKELALVKEYQEAMVECAAKLASYVHPKLANVEVKTEQVQPFVIRVPSVTDDPARWAREVSNPTKLIEAKPASGGRNGSGR